MNTKNQHMYGGVIVPMVTPFTEEGKIDGKAAGNMIQYLCKNDTIPFILGTSGEAYSIPAEERDHLVKVLIKHREEGIPLITGMGGLTYEDTILQANKYFSWGMDAVVLTLPGYFKLTDEQVYQYFYELSLEIKGNIILYNIPVTIHNSLAIHVIDKLSERDNIIGVKDSEFYENRMAESLKLWKDRADFFYLVGVNEMMHKGLMLGAKGLVPSTANLVPDLYNKMFAMHVEGKYDEVEKIQAITNEILSIYKNGYTLGESIAVLKYMVSLSGILSPNMRSPLTGLSDVEKKDIKVKWEKLNLRKLV
jgi:4-hydroxy-tetrahydrodipicolinate synthase